MDFEALCKLELGDQYNYHKAIAALRDEVMRINNRLLNLEAYNKENELRLHSEVGSESREAYVEFLAKQRERGW